MDQVLKVMRDYCLDILDVSEMRWTGQGHLMTDGATVLYSRKQDHHTHGVSIILSSCAAQALVGWKPVNDRIITARLHNRRAKFMPQLKLPQRKMPFTLSPKPCS